MQGVAQSAHRVEDQRFLTGFGRYLDDVQPRDCAAMVILRSPHAHAKILSVEVGEAEKLPGVLTILTGEQLAELGVADLPCLAPVEAQNDQVPFLPARPVLARDRVRYAGEPVVAIVAETAPAARDAAEAVMVEYELLDGVSDPRAAIDGGLAIWPEAPDNVAFSWSLGDAVATDMLFTQADEVVALDLVNNRVAGMSLETRGAIGEYDLRDGRYTLHVSSQGGHSIRRIIAQNVLRIPESNLRVVTPDVGGGFGPKIFVYPEYVLSLVAARRIGRPVKWICDRMESLQSDTQGRGQHCRAELALTREGRFLAMRFDALADLGGYPGQHGPMIATLAGAGLHPSVYAVQSVFLRVRGVFTNTVPTDSYRGAGRPEVIYAVERLVDAAARKLDISPDEIRRQNFVPRAAMPYRSATGQVYDDGDFAGLLDQGLKRANYAQREAERREALTRGKLRGTGLAYFIDRCGRGMDETAELRFDPSGSAVLFVGSQNNGQGHETAYANIVARELGLPRELVRVVQGDTDQVSFGRGTGGSRALAVGGNAVYLGTRKVLAKARRLAAHKLGCEEQALAFEDGLFRLSGTNRSLSFTDTVKLAFLPSELPKDMEPGLDEIAHFTPSAPTFPNGCHVATVEIDIATANLALVRYVAVNDVGTLLNRQLVDGQMHGGLAQGIGQALLERVVYDSDGGQMLTGSLNDYCYPKADDFGFFELDYVEIPCRSNPLGVKGCGEAGAIAAPPAVMNAVLDALRDHDCSGLQMPITACKLFHILHG
jgi:carbon-monoxide dehydrogenase large subunit